MKIKEALEKIAIGKSLSSQIDNKFREHCEKKPCMECVFCNQGFGCKQAWIDDNEDLSL